MLQLLDKTGERISNGRKVETRTYKNTVTGNEISIYHLYTDRFKNKWWAFDDLFTLPFIRQLAAKKVLDLYGNGLSLEDIKGISGELKTILKSDSPEKYEKAYAKALELDNLAETMADPVKQCMGLCTVYLLFNEENPDTWAAAVTSQKMTAMSLDIDAQSFFLNWWIDNMRQSGQVLKGLSRIASMATELSGNGTQAPVS
jgi:hypothetical protein